MNRIAERLLRYAGYVIDRISAFVSYLTRLDPRIQLVIFLVVGAILIGLSVAYDLMYRRVVSDMVAQQVMVSQWLGGLAHEGAAVGSTNYLIKFPFYAISDLFSGFTPPLVRLAAEAFLLTYAGWLLITYFVFKTLRLLTARPSVSQRFFIGMVLLYVAVISGEIFWVNYPNSRNIEVGLMVSVLYLVLALYLGKLYLSTKKLLVLSPLIGLVFLNDRYALYITGLLVVAYFGVTLLNALLRRSTDAAARNAISIIILFVGALAATYIFKKLVTTFTNISFIDFSPANELATFDQAVISFQTAVYSVLQLTGTALFETETFSLEGAWYAVNIALVGYVLYYAWCERLLAKVPRSVLAMLVWLIVGSILLYIMTGIGESSLRTYRYLILVPFILILMLALSRVRQYSGQFLVVLFVLTTMSAIIFSLDRGIAVKQGIEQRAWRDTNAVLYEIIGKTSSVQAYKGYSELAYGPSATYLTSNETLGLPVMCVSDPESGGHELRATPILIEEASHNLDKSQKTYIHLGRELVECDEQVARAQLGEPQEIIKLEENGVVFVYDRDITEELKADS